ncbi:cell adhesion molecule Dscam2-like isoform X2 [Frankliniella occidentalis]|uniref:Cell adhesion molecule Dscam2-like isoform X2 n=1 Tax=Frankliniella occidentalis TaxID=133901 RepID=A0A9C6X2S3_FRAOC|nr:cell adhesion molecule Dscam2-like isoform X2 [Frankliniella occidentalis]
MLAPGGRAARAILVILAAALLGLTGATYDSQGPTFTLEPSARVDLTNEGGAGVECSGRGNPAPRVEWRQGGGLGGQGEPGAAVRTVPGVRHLLDNGSLVFPPFQAAAFRQDIHWGVYRCVLSNSVGVVVSRDVAVRAVVNQHYEPEVQSPGGFHGNNVLIRCSVPPFVREHVTVTSWLQEPSFNIYPSAESHGKYHMLPTGELLVLNITEQDARHSFRCRTHHRLTQRNVPSANAGRIQLTDARRPVAPILHETTSTLPARLEEAVVVPCVAHANPPPVYRWWRQGQENSVDAGAAERFTVRDGTLSFASVRESDAGTYYCNASNSEGSEVLELTLQVWAPLAVHVLPPRQTVDVGKSADLTCQVAGFPRQQVTWLKDGRPIRGLAGQDDGGGGVGVGGDPGARIRLLAADRLHIAAVTKEDRGMYQCLVRNDHDMAQGAAELRLGDAAPTLQYKFIEQTMQPGPSVSLKCSASGNPTPHMSWKLDGFPLPPNDRVMIGQYVTLYGDVVSHVNISNVKAEDGGEYECEAESRAGLAKHQARLNIYGPPFVRAMPDIIAVAGKALHIKCPVAGYPIESVVWEKDGVVLPNIMRQRVAANTLTIENVQHASDQGAYTCTARAKHAHAAKRTVTVKVLVPPKITPITFPRDLNVGDRTSVQCVVVSGDLPLSFAWLKDGHPVGGAGHHHHPAAGAAGAGATAVPGDVSVRQNDDFSSALSIGAVALEHSGNYTCRVSNQAAVVSLTALLQVNGNERAPGAAPLSPYTLSPVACAPEACGPSQPGAQPGARNGNIDSFIVP